MSKDHVGYEPLNLALARTPPAATCADFCSRGPATQIGDMPLFLLLWPGPSRRIRATDRALSGLLASPQLGFFSTSQHGEHLTSTSSLIRQCQQICSPDKALMVTGWKFGEY